MPGISTFVLWDHQSQSAHPMHNEFQISSQVIFDMDKKDIEYEYKISDPEDTSTFIRLVQEKLEIKPVQVIPMSSLSTGNLSLSEEDVNDFRNRVAKVSNDNHRNLVCLAELYPVIKTENDKEPSDEEKQERAKIDGYINAIEALDNDSETITDYFTFIPNRHEKNKFDQTTRASIGRSETAHKARVSVKRVVFKRGKPGEEATEGEKIALREFSNCLTVEASLGFRPVFGFSGLVKNDELLEIHIIEPWIPFTLQDLLTSNLKRNPGIETTKAEAVSYSTLGVDPKVDLFLADEIQLAFQLVQIIEEMRYDYRVLKHNVFAAHCDIKPDNILVLRMPAPYGWLTLLFDVETARVHSQLENNGITIIMRHEVAEITRAKKKLNGEIRDHLHDIDRLQDVILKIVSKSNEKEPWFSKFETIVKKLESTNKGDQFNIFEVSFDFHLVCVWVLAGLCYEENSEALFDRLKTMVDKKTLCGDLCAIPDPFDFADVEPKPLFNWIYVVQEGEGLNMKLKVKVGVSTQKPEGSVIYVSSEHTTTQQTQTMVVICQILEHLFLLFPFDPLLASTVAG